MEVQERWIRVDPEIGEDDLTRIAPGWFSGITRVIVVDMPNTQSANALEWVDHRTSLDAIEDSTRAMRRCLDVLNVLGTDLQGLLEVGVEAGGPG